MPILEVEMVTGTGEVLKDGLARELADLAGTILGSSPGGTWVRLRPLPDTHYAENGVRSGVVYPVFVSILVGHCPPRETMKQQADKLASAFSQACGRPQENIHILFQPDASGRIAFGGKLPF